MFLSLHQKIVGPGSKYIYIYIYMNHFLFSRYRFLEYVFISISSFSESLNHLEHIIVEYYQMMDDLLIFQPIFKVSLQTSIGKPSVQARRWGPPHGEVARFVASVLGFDGEFW